VARNDPTDTGGLFIGRRPGTAPIRFREGAQPGGARRQRFDRLLAWALLAIELTLCLSLLGPQPLGWMWVGSQVEYLTGYVTAAISTIMVGCLVSLFLTMVAAKRVDHAWKLVRRAAGHHQERGALERIFVTSVAIVAVAFSFWLIVIRGPGSGVVPERPA
jgi:fumarate reductase subunit D